MRVLRIIASVDPRDGGPIAGMRATALEMAAQGGHETEVVSLDPPDAAHLREFPFPVHGCGPAPRRYGYTPRLAAWIAREGHRFDAAVVHGLWNHASIGGWQGVRRAGLPYVLYTHGMMDPWFREAYPLKHWAKQVFWLVQGKALCDAASVLFTSAEEMRLARGVFWGHGGYQGRVVAYGVPGAALPDPEAAHLGQAGFATLCPGLGGRRYLLFLSRIHPKKGVDLLLEAFARLAPVRPDLDLVVAGPDQVGLVASLAARAAALGISGRVHWPGMLSGAVKQAAFGGAEAFVLPSHQENFGLVVAEALACGTPVLITDKVNIWREVVAEKAGFVAPDTTDGIAAMLSYWNALAPEAKATLRAAAHPCYEKHFTIRAAARDLTAALEAAVGGLTGELRQRMGGDRQQS